MAEPRTHSPDSDAPPKSEAPTGDQPVGSDARILARAHDVLRIESESVAALQGRLGPEFVAAVRLVRGPPASSGRWDR